MDTGWLDARKWGWLGVGLFALGVGLAVFFTTVAVDPRDREETVPAFGTEGFNTEVFCKDDATTVEYLPVPDGSKRYTLTRTKDNRMETVTFNDLAPGGTYYFDGPNGQEDRPAAITDEARKCMEEKGKVFVPRAQTSEIPQAPSVNQPHPDIFPCGNNCNMQLLNPLTVKAKALRTANYRLVTQPSCISGTIPQDMARLEQHMMEEVAFRLVRNDVGYDFTVRINCGNDHIRICGSIYIFCLGRGFPYNPDVDLSDILSSYQVETRLSIPLHEVAGHAIATWNEQYCLGSEGSGVCAGQPQFNPAPNWPDFMNTGVLSRHGFTDLEKDRWARTMYPLVQQCFSDPCWNGVRWVFTSGWEYEPGTDSWWYRNALTWQRADQFGWRYSPIGQMAWPGGQIYFHGPSGQHALVP